MKSSNILFGTGALAFLYFMLRGKKDAVNELEVKLASLSFNNKKTREALFLNLFFDVRLNVNNPTPGNITIKHIYIEIFGNDKILGGVSKNEQFTIKGKSANDINFSAKIITPGAVNFIIDLLKSGQEPELFGQGYIDTNLGRINFKKAF